MQKIEATLDVETYRNYFLIKFRRIDNGARIWFEQYEGVAFDRHRVQRILDEYRIITFNGINYDMPMVMLALRGMTNADLKSASDMIIRQGMKHWQTEKYFDYRTPEHYDHIDLIETIPGVQIGLKLYGARMHTKLLQDLPYSIDKDLTRAEMINVRTYCGNDHVITGELYAVATDPRDNIIATRMALGSEYGMDLRSKSDAQCAEAIIRSEVGKRRGEKIYKQIIPPGTTYRYTPPAFISFRTPLLQETLAEIRAAAFVIDENGKVDLPDALKKKKLSIGGSTYKMGIGGLHSTEKSKAHFSTPTMQLFDRDVVSYYPSLILQCGLFPLNMGEAFQTVYRNFFNQRIAAKKAGNKSVAQTLKILLNGTFGKLGSMYSTMYSPDLLIQVTLTGQLALLMLIERMELAGNPVVSANTDGIVMACPLHLQPTMLRIVAEWEKETGLETEETRYRGLLSRDVNNYLALKEGGGVKTKGVLTAPGIAKNPSYSIVATAAIELIEKGVPIGTTIYGCTDIRQFVSVKRVTGGGAFDDVYLGKTVRWYRSRNSRKSIRYVSNGNQVGGSENAQPVMTLPDSLPLDIDYNFYMAKANELLGEIGYV